MSKTALLATTAIAAKKAKRATENTDGKFTTLKEATLNKPLVWLTIIGIGAYAVYKLGLAIKKKLTLSNADADIKAAEKTGEKLTYSLGNYTQFADQIYAAVLTVFGTDEQAIYAVFNKMQNNLDVAQLIKAFGKRRLEFSTTMAELGAHLSEDLYTSEINKLNSILAAKNITYRF